MIPPIESACYPLALRPHQTLFDTLGVVVQRFARSLTIRPWWARDVCSRHKSGHTVFISQCVYWVLEWSEIEYAAHPNTHRRYRISSKPLLGYFGNTTLDRINTSDVEKFKTWRARQKKLPQGLKSKKARKAAKQLRPGTVNRELACLKHLFKRNEEVIARNPVKGVKFLDEDNEQTRVLNAEEEKRYLLAAFSHFKTSLL